MEKKRKAKKIKGKKRGKRKKRGYEKEEIVPCLSILESQF